MKRNYLLAAMLLLLCGRLMAAAPMMINYQARLTTPAGAAGERFEVGVLNSKDFAPLYAHGL